MRCGTTQDRIRYYFARSTEGATEAATADEGAVGVVNAATEEFLTDNPIQGPGVHSVAVSAKNRHIFVPVNWKRHTGDCSRAVKP